MELRNSILPDCMVALLKTVNKLNCLRWINWSVLALCLAVSIRCNLVFHSSKPNVRTQHTPTHFPAIMCTLHDIWSVATTIRVDFAAYGSIGFSKDMITLQGGHDAVDVVVLPLSRDNGSEGHVSAEWVVHVEDRFVTLISPESDKGTIPFVDGESKASIALRLNPDWVEGLEAPDPVDVVVVLTSANRGAELRSDNHVCLVRLLPGEEIDGLLRFLHLVFHDAVVLSHSCTLLLSRLDVLSQSTLSRCMVFLSYGENGRVVSRFLCTDALT